MEKNNYHHKITYLLSIIAVIISLFLVFLGGYIFQLQKVNYKNSVATNFEEKYRSAETKIEIFKNISKLTFKSDAVKDFADKTYLNKYYSYVLMEEYIINHNETLIPLCATMAVTDFEDVFITTNGIKSKEEYLEEYKITKEILENAGTDGSLIDINPSYYTFIFRHKYPTNSVIYCIINAEKKFFLSSDANSILDIADKNTSASFKSKNMVKAFASLDKNSVWYDISKKGVSIRSSYHINNMVYLYETLQTKTHYYFLFLFLILFAILMMSWKRIIMWISNLFYKPLSNVFDMLGYSDNSGDIELLGNSVSKLIQDNNSLRSNLTQSNFDLQNLFIKNLLYGTFQGNSFDIYAKKLNITELNSEYVCIIFDCYNNDSKTQLDYINDPDKIHSNCSELLNKILKDALPGEFATIEKLKFAFITRTVSKSTLTTTLLTLQDIFNNFMGYYPFIAVGKTAESLKDVHKSFSDASKIISSKFNYTDSFLVFYDDLPVSEITYYYPIELENNLIESILYGRAEKANEIISELVDTNLFNLSLSHEKLNDFIFALSATIKRIIYMLNKKTDDILDEGIFADIDSLSTNEEIAEKIRNTVNKLIVFTANNTKANHNKLISDILNYIADNYDKDISLDDVAEHFRRSSSQITRILNQDAGVSFKEHLNKTRVEEAKKQLLNSDTTTDKISENVGYINTRTFFRVFRKYTGHSPSEYRNLMRNAPNE